MKAIGITLLIFILLFGIKSAIEDYESPADQKTNTANRAASNLAEIEAVKRRQLYDQTPAGIAAHKQEARVLQKKADEAAKEIAGAKSRELNTALAASALRQALRNPESLTFESASTNADGSIVCLVYRAQNGFGGMNREFAYARRGILHLYDGNYNQVCYNNPQVAYDVTNWANFGAKYGGR